MASNNEWRESLRNLSEEEIHSLPWPARVAVRWLRVNLWLRFLAELIPGVLIALVLLWIPGKPDAAWVGPAASLCVFLAYAVFPTKRLIAALRAEHTRS